MARSKNPMFEVYEERCSECLYGNQKIVSDERRRELLDRLKFTGKHFVCHLSSMNRGRVCCRGFYDANVHWHPLLQIAQRLGFLRFVPTPFKEEAWAKCGAPAKRRSQPEPCRNALLGNCGEVD